jgi:hypothetical protein
VSTSTNVAAAMLCQRRSLSGSGSQHAGSNNQNLLEAGTRKVLEDQIGKVREHRTGKVLEDRTAKDKARHIVTLLAASKLKLSGSHKLF